MTLLASWVMGIAGGLPRGCQQHLTFLTSYPDSQSKTTHVGRIAEVCESTDQHDSALDAATRTGQRRDANHPQVDGAGGTHEGRTGAEGRMSFFNPRSPSEIVVGA